MLVPLAALDFELAASGGKSIPLAARYRRARVLVRWSGVPVGVVEVSVRDGCVWPDDILQAFQKTHPGALPREAVRRALLETGVGAALDLSSVWHRTGRRAVSPAPLSVIVCTRDRPADMASCLAALARLDPAPHEILIVDNAPATEATSRLVQDYPNFRYVREPQPGLDHARNRGLAETSGDLVAFTDDDVVVDPGWVGALLDAFDADPAIGLITGLVEPLEQETRAQIFFERYGGFGRGCRRTYSQVPRARRMPWTLVGAGQLGAGANMAFRREVFDRIGLFDPVLDVGTPTLGGGDHDIFFRVLHAGYLCVYEPAALVRHRHRRTVAELRRLLFSYGHATRCLFDREERNFPPDRPAVQKLRRWWWRHWAWARCWRAIYRPALLPASLVLEEIKGYRRARGAYAKARRQLVPDESARVDAERPAPPRPLANPGGAVGILNVDVSRPLNALPQAADFDAVEIVVQWQGRPVGSFRLASHGQPVSARRLADEIVHHVWYPLLEPAGADPAPAYVRLADAFAARVGAVALTAAPKPKPLATIVLTTCNRPVELRRCLESLVALRTIHPVQIVVVDNRPETGSAAPVLRDFPQVELVLETRRGSSYARNAGVTAARGDFVAMVDDDMRVAPDWLEKLLAPFARADVVAVTGNTLAARLETEAERLLECYGGFCRGFTTRDFDFRWFHGFRYRAVPTWKIGGSGNVAFRREIFSWRAIGRFDETLGAGVPTGVGEDTKIFYDILHAGYTIVYESAAIAWHFHRANLPALRRQLYGYSKGHVAYHLATWRDHRDARALVRIFLELPQAFCSRALDRLRGASPYPLRLLLLEFWGTLAGPWSLWRAYRLAKHVRRRARLDTRPPRLPLLIRKQLILEGQP